MGLFNYDGTLEEDVEDILYELGNVGVGMVSNTIGDLLGLRVEIGIPIIEKADNNILNHIENKEAVKIGFLLDFKETLKGSVLLLLDDAFVRCAVEMITEEKTQTDKILTDLEYQSALEEFANVIVASYMNAMGSYTGLRIFVTPIQAMRGMTERLLQKTLEHLNTTCNEALCINTVLSIVDMEGNRMNEAGNFIMMPDDTSVNKIVEAMDI